MSETRRPLPLIRIAHAGSAPTEPSPELRNLTLLIKTHARPQCLQALLASIDKHYGSCGSDLTILIADDSALPRSYNLVGRNTIHFYWFNREIGLSGGRNFLVERTATKYVMLLDDDFIFTSKTDLRKAVELISTTPHKIIGGVVIDKGSRWRYNGNFYIEDGIFHIEARKRFPKRNTVLSCQILLNFFIADRKTLLSVPWDERLRMEEHWVFFIDCKRAKIPIAETDLFEIVHAQKRPRSYAQKRASEARIGREKLATLYGITGVKYL